MLNRWLRGILLVGYHSQLTKPRITLAGQGAVLYTDDERGDTSLGTRDDDKAAAAPSVILARAKFKSLTIEDLTIERKITGGRPSEPGNYGPAVPPPGGQLSYWDHPGINNRVGVYLVPFDNAGFPSEDTGEIEHITIKNVTFVDCHRAVHMDHPPDVNLPKYAGKLLNLDLLDSKFIYPYGANVFLDYEPRGYGDRSGGTATHITPWVRQLLVNNCIFDGAANGDVSDNYFQAPLDGFIFGAPIRMICTNNRLRHFMVEGIFNLQGGLSVPFKNTPATLTMPAINAKSGFLTLGQPLPFWMPVGCTNGLRVWVGDYSQGGFFRIADVSTDRMQIKLLNLGESNPEPTTSIPLTVLLNFDGMETAIANISSNDIDGTPPTGLEPPMPAVPREDPFEDIPPRGVLGYGNPAIRVNTAQATVTGNSIVNVQGGIKLVSSPYAESIMHGSQVTDNYILLADTRQLEFSACFGLVPTQEVFGISAEFDNALVERNTIRIPFGHRAYGILLDGDNSIVRNNSIEVLNRASTYDYDGVGGCPPETTYSYGIHIPNPRKGGLIAGNITENLGIGIYIPLDAQVTIESHQSTGDGQLGAWWPSKVVYRNQEVSFKPSVSGWYRILVGATYHLKGKLSIKYDGSSGDFFDAELRIDQSAYNTTRHLIQESFYASATPFIDKVMLGGLGVPEIFVHVIQPPPDGTAIRLKLETDTPGCTLSDHAENAPANRTFQSISTTNGSSIATIATPSVEGLTVPPTTPLATSIYLFDTGTPKFDGGYLVQSVNASNNTFTVQLPEAATTPQTASVLGSFFITGNIGGGNTAVFPCGYELFVTLSKGDAIQLAGGGISLGGGSLSAPAINFGVNGDGNTGIFQDNVSSIGIAIDGSLVAKFDNGGIEMYAGSQSAPGYSFSSDGNTGMYLAGDDQIGIATGGLERMVIGNTGVVIEDSLKVKRTGIEISGASSTLKVSGSGSPANAPVGAIKRVLSQTQFQNIASIAASSASSFDITVNGAAVGDTVLLGGLPDTIPGPIVYSAFVSAANTVTVRARNTGGTASDPDGASGSTYRVTIFQF